MSILNASQVQKTVADPIAAYESIVPVWERSRAACSGERYVKDFDGSLDVYSFSNLLIPFSPSMTPVQYNFYKAEAEYPGIVAQYVRTLIGGLLRKKPSLKLSKEDYSEEIQNWIMNAFTEDDNTLISFLDEALWEELQTSRAWVYVDYPRIENAESLTTQDFASYKPYPILWKAESIINWKLSKENGKQKLTQIIFRGNEERYTEKNEFHPELVDTVWVHEIIEGKYQIRKFQKEDGNEAVAYISGKEVKNVKTEKPVFKLVETISGFLVAGKPLDFIPAWPLNGSYDLTEPMLMPLIDKEIALYNKLSRRNHLLYGAATYTPVISSDMTDDEFQDIVGAGLGSWIHLRQGDVASVLETPTAALQDMDRAIASNIEEMAKMGIRMLTPESAQSGVALEIRNAAQTAQLGTLNAKVSSTLSAIIAFMINWKYGIELNAGDITFTMSDDFNPTPLGADWLRLATEWYENGLIPRSIWLSILKQNDIVPPEYDDKDGIEEINSLGVPAINQQAAFNGLEAPK